MVNTTGIGKAAEETVSQELQKRGYKIVDRNWRKRVCEIDLIATKGGIVYFVEVKYRTSVAQGTGLDYITPKKLNQIKFAAELWTAENNWQGDWQILATSVNSIDLQPTVEEIVEVF